MFVFMLLSFTLCGCISKMDNKEQELQIYNLEIDFYNEYAVSDFNDIYIYFPVVTNKEITSTELGGVGSKLNLKNLNGNNDTFKAKLIAQSQDYINMKYNNYFISFLKYKLEITNIQINYYSSIYLDDTKLWVLSGEEIQEINLIDKYLKIYITPNSNEEQTPNWNDEINKMLYEIKLQLNKNI